MDLIALLGIVWTLIALLGIVWTLIALLGIAWSLIALLASYGTLPRGVRTVIFIVWIGGMEWCAHEGSCKLLNDGEDGRE